MPLRSSWADQPCPIARGIDALGDPWSLLILREALTGATRFDDFGGRLDIADNILASRLKAMVERGLLERVAYHEGARPRYRYLLTEAGRDALPVLQAFAVWARDHTPTTPATDLEIVCTRCGGRSTRAESCSHCDAALTTDTVRWIRHGRWHGTEFALEAV